MAIQPTTASTASPSLRAAQVYAMAGICLVVGLAVGYLLRGSPSPAPPAPVAQRAAPATPSANAMTAGHVSTLEAMMQLANQQAAPLLEKLKTDPSNSAVLAQLGAIYHSSHQFEQAATYYGKAVEADPKNVGLRTKLATSLYRGGDVDGAIAQLNRALSYDPKDANALFDLGMIKLNGKQDGKGALAAWQQLLKSNPQLSEDRKTTVQKLMADVLNTMDDQRHSKGAKSHDGHKSSAD